MLLPIQYATQVFRLGSGAFASGSLGYYFLALFLRDEDSVFVFGATYRMILFHHDHPLEFIGLVSLVFGLLAPLFQGSILRHTGLRRHGVYGLLVGATLVIALPFGGLLWCHYWCVGDLEGTLESWAHLFASRTTECLLYALRFGPSILLFSFPYNLLGWFVGLRLLRHFAPTAPPKEGSPCV